MGVHEKDDPKDKSGHVNPVFGRTLDLPNHNGRKSDTNREDNHTPTCYRSRQHLQCLPFRPG